MKNLAYIGTSVLVLSMILLEIFSLPSVTVPQIITIAAFNICAALLFVLSGLMKDKKEGWEYILLGAVLVRAYTYLHIYGMFGWNEIAFDMFAANTVIVFFELAVFFISSPGNYTSNLQGEKGKYQDGWESLLRTFSEYPLYANEEYPNYVKRIRQSLLLEYQTELEQKEKEIRSEIEQSFIKKFEQMNTERIIEQQVNERTNTIIEQLPNNVREQKSEQKTNTRSRSKMSEQEKIDLYNEFIQINERTPTGKEMAEFWDVPEGTARRWKSKFNGQLEKLSI